MESIKFSVEKIKTCLSQKTPESLAEGHVLLCTSLSVPSAANIVQPCGCTCLQSSDVQGKLDLIVAAKLLLWRAKCHELMSLEQPCFYDAFCCVNMLSDLLFPLDGEGPADALAEEHSGACSLLGQAIVSCSGSLLRQREAMDALLVLSHVNTDLLLPAMPEDAARAFESKLASLSAACMASLALSVALHKYPRTVHLFDAGGSGVARDDLVMDEKTLKVNSYVIL